MTSNTPQQVAPIPATCFHKFPELPAEIRVMIWNMALCYDTTPRLHYYSIFSDDRNGQRESPLNEMIRQYMTQPRPPRFLGNGQPWPEKRLRSEPKEMKWAKANRFDYFWDDGLRLACCESREVFLPYLRLQKARENLIDTRKRKPSHSKCVVKCKDRGQDAELRIRTRRDIICLRFGAESMKLSFLDEWWPALLERLPFFHLPQTHDFNIAIEFDDSSVVDLVGPNRLKGTLWWEHQGRPPPPLDDAQKRCLEEISNRGIAIRAYWAWRRGLIPRRSRLRLIDRRVDQFPSTIKCSAGGDDRTFPRDYVYESQPRQVQKKNLVFTDGKRRYVESYDYKASTHSVYKFYERESMVPVLDFMYKMKYCYTPPFPEEEGGPWPERPTEFEHFFRVLRQLPGPDSPELRRKFPGADFP